MSDLTEQEKRDIQSFTWNSKPSTYQLDRMNMMRRMGKELCEYMIESVKNCPDRSAAIRDLRKAIMQCNLAIAHENIDKADK